MSRAKEESVIVNVINNISIVITNKVDYDSKFHQIVTDTTIFKLINGDLPTTIVTH